MSSYRYMIRTGRIEIQALRFVILDSENFNTWFQFQSKRTRIRSESSKSVRIEHATWNSNWENYNVSFEMSGMEPATAWAKKNGIFELRSPNTGSILASDLHMLAVFMEELDLNARNLKSISSCSVV